MPTLPAFESTSALKPLSFDPAKLNGLSERLIRSHWENNYGGSVKALGVVKKQLAQALADKDMPPFIYNALKREHLLRTGSVVFHEYYFAGGSGWVILGFNSHTRQIENYWLADHAHGPAATVPLLVMDMYEHSYQMDFGAAAPRYIDAFFKNIQWEVVARRLESAQRTRS